MTSSWQANVYAIPQIIAAALCIVCLCLLWKRRWNSAAAYDLVFVLVCACWWSIAGTLEFCAGTVKAKVFLTQLSYLGIVGAVWTLFRFTIAYTDSLPHLPRRAIPIFAMAGVVILAMVFTNGTHGLFWSDVYLIERNGFVFGYYQRGPIFWLNVLYCYSLLLWSCMLLFRHAVFTMGIYRFQSLVTIMAVICPWAASLAYILRMGPMPELDNTPAGFALGSVLMTWNILKGRLLDLSPVATHLLFTNMRDPMLVTDIHNRLVNANPASVLRFGLQNRRQGLPVGEVFDDRPEIRALLLDSSGLLTRSTIFDRDRWWDIEASVLRTAKGNFRGRLFVFRDATELKKAELVLRRTKNELEVARAKAVAADEAKTHFLAAMSHEIRTPLNAIAGYARILQENKSMPREALSSLRAVRDASDHLLHLIEGILDLSKIEAGKTELMLADFDLNALLRSVEAIFYTRCSEKGINLVLDICGTVPEWVKGDEGKIRQVLMNLLGNAVKFTDSGEVCLEVRSLRDDMIRFVISDTGTGIDDQEIERIFALFEQSKHGRARGGTGLGLSISRKLAAIMGGQLGVESKPGKGSRFTFELPLPRGRVSLDGGCDVSLRQWRIVSECNVRVLVVDDVKINRTLLLHILQGMNCQTFEAATAQEALSAFAAHRPHIAFLDINLDGHREGIEIAGKIRELHPDASPFLVCYSAAAFQHEWDEFRKAGFDDFLPKPIRFERVRECMEKLSWVRWESAG